MGSLYLSAVSFLPSGATRTMGLVPFAWAGNRLVSRSEAAWLSVPGSVRSLLSSWPAVLAHAPIPIRMTAQIASTLQWRLAQKPPSQYRGRVMRGLCLSHARALEDNLSSRQHPHNERDADPSHFGDLLPSLSPFRTAPGSGGAAFHPGGLALCGSVSASEENVRPRTT